MGVVTPLGTTIHEMFQNLIAGKSGIGAITRFNAKSFPTTFAAEIKNFDLAKYVKDLFPWKDCGVNSCFAAAAAQQALEDAGLLDNAKVDHKVNHCNPTNQPNHLCSLLRCMYYNKVLLISQPAR